MPVQKFAPLLLITILLSACSRNIDETEEIPESPTTGTPVETGAANTNYQPAFSGQTRINGVTTSAGITTSIVTSTLVTPWGIAAIPDGRLLVTEKGGSMRIVSTTGAVSGAITGIPAVNSAGQGGLLGLCIDPAFATSRMVYWVFSENGSGGTVTAVAKGRLSDDESTFENSTVIYRALPYANSTLHYGGRILFDATGNLIVSTGERSNVSTRPLAQDVSTALGKIVRITTNGTAAPQNPTFSAGGARPELYSIGHRNPQGIALHPVTGDLWQSEHGPRGGDEINRVMAGANYGWPTITYGIEYGGEPIGEAIQQRSGMEQPVYYWDPVISPSGIMFYRGNRVAEWQNNLFVTSLSATHIARLVIDNNKVTGEERLLASEGQRFRDLTQGTDGAIYAVTDGGRMYKIDRSN
ncbi:MAG: PQQ-dependent sugar dehydrogenase [Flavitalea sp.]